MLKNYLKIAWRNLKKNKVFSLINITGLTIGVTVCLMIFLFIMNEFSVDNFHKNENLIFRVMRGYDKTKPRVPYLSGPYATALQNDFPKQIRKITRIQINNALISFDNKAFNEKHVLSADDNFFTIFSFPLLMGNPETVLLNPGSVVLTKTTAIKYFGSIENAMNKRIDVNKQLHLKVTGIASDIPSNSHLDFDLVLPLSNYFQYSWFNVWINNNFFTYVLLNKPSDKQEIEKGLPAFMDKYMGTDMAKFGFHFDLALTPLKDIYFENASVFDYVKHGDKKVVYIFLSIAVLILVIACINFMNLSTIRAVERSREVGLRKVMGAMRNHLIWQFIGESLLLTLISCALSIGLLQILMPLYNHLLGYELNVSWNSWPIYLFLLGVILVAGFLAGSYPAIFLSGFSPIQALKGKLKLGKGGSYFRQSLVVLQFSISVFLIIGTIIIVTQMRYVKNKNLGYNEEQTIIVPINNNDFYDHRFTFKRDLQMQPGISSVSMMSGEPGGFFDIHAFHVEGKNNETFQFRTEFADFEFVKTLGLKIEAGRDFSSSFPTDTANAVLINATAAAALGWTPDQSLGKWIKNTVRDSIARRVVGVVQDFNFLSLKENMQPLVISPNEDRRVALISIQPGNIVNAISEIKKEYSSVAPVYPFEYTFLDQKFDELYKNDLHQQSILMLFAGLAIFIACLGLFGLASFTTAKRTKEISMRKILGSSAANIVVMLSKDLLKPVLIASCIAVPIGYWAMGNWLNNFAYKTSLHWWIFVLSSFITIVIALATVSFKALKASLASPITNLRGE